MKKSELEAILSEVEVEIADLLKSQSSELRKGAEEASPEADDSAAGAPGGDSAPGGAPDASASAPGDASASAPADAQGSPEGASPEGAPAPEGGAEGAPADPASAGAGPVDPAALEAEYEKLPPEELKAHYLAAKAAIFKLMGGGAGSPGPEAPPAGPDASASAGPGAGAPPPAGPGGGMPPPAMKGEKSGNRLVEPKGSAGGISIPANGGVVKSEPSIQEQLDVLTKALSMMANQPVRKAVLNLSDVSKSEAPVNRNLSRAEVTAKLTEKSADPSLAKSDRQAINDYYDGKITIEKMPSHLLQ